MPPPTPSTTAGREDDRAESADVLAAESVSDCALRTVRSSPPGDSLAASPASSLATGSRLRFDWLRGQQACLDFAQRDRQRLLVDMRLDQRPDVFEQALAELAVTNIDLASAVARVD